MMQRNPEGWQSIKDLLMGTTVWEQVKNDRNYTDIKDDENAVALLDHVRRALTKFWIWVGTDLFGIKDFKSIDEVIERVLLGLVNST